MSFIFIRSRSFSLCSLSLLCLPACVQMFYLNNEILRILQDLLSSSDRDQYNAEALSDISGKEEEEIEKKKPTTVVGAFSDVFYLNILMNGQQIQFLGFHNVCIKREKGTDNNAPNAIMAVAY